LGTKKKKRGGFFLYESLAAGRWQASVVYGSKGERVKKRKGGIGEKQGGKISLLFVGDRKSIRKEGPHCSGERSK